MSNYQSLPSSPGASNSLAELRALNIPPLAGKSFLDVGCNEGLSCGYAAFDGATHVVGLDSDEHVIARARERFPHCTFLAQHWNQLPVKRFDVILLASALHYADDQPALIARLVERLAPGGVLVLELGVHAGEDNRWVRVQCGDHDTRSFPTRARLMEILAPYACRFMGASVREPGDPVPREVVHVSARRPMAFLLLANPGAGKTNLARSVFTPAGLAVVNGDALLHEVALGRQSASPALQELVRQDHSPRTLDRSLQRVFSGGLGAELVGLWLARGQPGRDICIDAFVPAEFRPQVADWVRDAGYVPVRMEWDPLGPRSQAPDATERRVAEYLAALDGAPLEPQPIREPEVRRRRPAAMGAGVKGHVDGMALSADRLLSVRGWAVDDRGERPAQLSVTVNGQAMTLERVDAVERHDVQRHFGLHHASVGFIATLRLDAELTGGLDPAHVVVCASAEPGMPATPLIHARHLKLVRA